METLLKIVTAVAAFGFSAACLPLKQYQLAYYRLGETFTALCRRKGEAIILPFVLSVMAAIGAIVAAKFGFYPYFVSVAGGFFVTAAVCIPRSKLNKSKVVVTPRLKRFLITYLFFCAIFGFAAYFLPGIAAVPSCGTAVAFLLTHGLRTPIEKKRNKKFVADAKSKLDKIDPLRIGITGSYGKTTFKNVLAAILSEKYRVCVSRGNFNTPLGLARTIKEGMTEDVRIFVAEAGARYVGDISELAELIRPDYAVVTAIGNQHLETFGSAENIKNEKFEIVRALEDGNNAFFGSSARELFKRNGKGYAVGVNVFAENVRTEGDKTYFTAKIGHDEIGLCTRLCGDYLPETIALATAVALRLGVPRESIKKSVAGLISVAHRQQLLYNGNDVIIDDAYNANEEGAKSALRLLGGFRGKTRVVVTPGVVELGIRQYDANYEIGEYAAKRCDFAIFIGANARALALGAECGGAAKNRIYEVDSLDSATEILKKIKGERAILFENDLPDNYR